MYFKLLKLHQWSASIFLSKAGPKKGQENGRLSKKRAKDLFGIHSVSLKRVSGVCVTESKPCFQGYCSLFGGKMSWGTD